MAIRLNSDSLGHNELLGDPGSLVITPGLKAGLSVVSSLALVSWWSSCALLVHLSYKLVRWQIKQTRLWRKGSASSAATATATQGVAITDAEMPPPSHAPLSHFPLHGQTNPNAAATTAHWPKGQSRAPNQFLVLIVNLLIADIKQATAFVLNLQWVHRDLIDVTTGTCWAQGWFVSVGDLASSVFVMAIAVHTYFSVVKSKQMPTAAFYAVIAALWFFVYFMAAIGIIVVHANRRREHLYTRAGAWCWINAAHQDLRLALHYLWIFIALASTTIIYILIFMHIQRDVFKSTADDVDDDQPPRPDSSAANYASDGSIGPKGAPLETRTLDRAMTSTPVPQNYPSQSRHQNQQKPRKAHIWSNFRQHIFLLYPIIYVLCTTPLAASRIAIMAGRHVSLSVLCFAGAAISCNGWLDVLLYATTRRSIIFGSDMGASETGLATFAFMHEPGGKRLGNETVIESARRQHNKADSADDGAGGLRSNRSRWGLGKRNNGSSHGGRSGNRELNGSMELKGFPNRDGGGGSGTMGIHQTKTTMVVLEDTEEFDGKAPSGKASVPPSAGLSRSDSVRSLI